MPLRYPLQEKAIMSKVTVGEFVPLEERALQRDGTVPLKIIAPGWGSSGYYPAEVLERDGPKVFKSGLKMYWNHPTATEEAERPERDLRDLAGELVSDARWDANGPKGPGLYAQAKVFEGYKGAVEELAPHIGVSIRAVGRARAGEADGRQGAIIEQLVQARSIDYVTEPGAGGKVLQLFEAARPQEQETPIKEAHNTAEWLESRIHLIFTQFADDLFGEGKITREERIALSGGIGQALNAFNAAVQASAPELYKRGRWAAPEPMMDDMDESAGDGSAEKLQEADMTELEEAKAALAQMEQENARLREGAILREARDVVSSALAKIEMPGITRARLVEAALVNPPIKEGALDKEALATRVQEAAKAELTYLAGAAGYGSGQIVGLGESAAAGREGSEDEALKQLGEAFQDMGLSESRAAIAAKGR
jgi:hypothetical protein